MPREAKIWSARLMTVSVVKTLSMEGTELKR
jgi:hypothetical protein